MHTPYLDGVCIQPFMLMHEQLELVSTNWSLFLLLACCYLINPILLFFLTYKLHNYTSYVTFAKPCLLMPRLLQQETYHLLYPNMNHAIIKILKTKTPVLSFMHAWSTSSYQRFLKPRVLFVEEMSHFPSATQCEAEAGNSSGKCNTFTSRGWSTACDASNPCIRAAPCPDIAWSRETFKRAVIQELRYPWTTVRIIHFSCSMQSSRTWSSLVLSNWESKRRLVSSRLHAERSLNISIIPEEYRNNQNLSMRWLWLEEPQIEAGIQSDEVWVGTVSGSLLWRWTTIDRS